MMSTVTEAEVQSHAALLKKIEEELKEIKELKAEIGNIILQSSQSDRESVTDYPGMEEGETVLLKYRIALEEAKRSEKASSLGLQVLNAIKNSQTVIAKNQTACEEIAEEIRGLRTSPIPFWDLLPIQIQDENRVAEVLAECKALSTGSRSVGTSTDSQQTLRSDTSATMETVHPLRRNARPKKLLSTVRKRYRKV